jgi:hypothetical protein
LTDPAYQQLANGVIRTEVIRILSRRNKYGRATPTVQYKQPSRTNNTKNLARIADSLLSLRTLRIGIHFDTVPYGKFLYGTVQEGTV